MTDERKLALPETQHVRWWWTEGRQKGVTMAQSDAQFDSWLAAHDAEKDAQVAELQAVIAATREWLGRRFVPHAHGDIRAILDAAPSDVLAARDAQVAADALEGFAASLHEWYPEDLFGPMIPEDHGHVNAILKEHSSVSRDRISADMMRHAARLALRQASEVRGTGTPDEKGATDV